MKFLAIDTGAKYLSVLACREGTVERSFLPDCALRHSVLLMDEIDRVLTRAQMSPRECDFFSAVVGPGSFTGIRIGISTVKGLALSCEKPVLPLTSFDVMAYAEGKSDLLALVDAGHGHFYACAYRAPGEIARAPAFLSREEVEALVREGFAPVATEPIFPGCNLIDPAEGLLRAAKEKAREASKAPISALYLRKSSAEEHRI